MNSKFGLVRVACGLIDVEIGNPEVNGERVAELLACAEKEEADVLLLPELGLTGYTCGDLFLQKSLHVRCEKALATLLERAGDERRIVCLGMPVVQHGTLFNAAVLFQGRTILGVMPKTFVPNSQEFYERRWFAPSYARTANEICLCGQTVPFTPNLLVEAGDLVLACEICEDLWVNMPPSSRHTAFGANLVLNPSASNEVATKARYRRDLVRMQSGRCLCAYAYASSGAGESTTDLVFSGHCLIAENARLAAESRDRMGLTSAVIDLERLANDRLKDPCFAQSPVDEEVRKSYLRVRALPLPETGIMPEQVDPSPFVPKGAELDERCREILRLQAAGLARRYARARAKCMVLGISGGLDSTLALLVAASACDRLGLDRSHILAVTMPGFGTTNHTKDNALTLMTQLGVRQKTIDIREACLGHFRDIGHDSTCYDVTYENAQARERTQILMDLANSEDGLVVGTGDMSELALGWATYNGDHMSMYGVNAGVPKTLVRFLVEEYARMHEEVRDVLLSIAATEISPELLPPDAQGNRQSTEGTIGKYVLHDFFLYHFVRNGFAREKILALARIAFPGEEEMVERTLDTFFRRFFAQQFKRSCLPDGPKVGTVSLSPRGDWRMPSDMDCSM